MVKNFWENIFVKIIEKIENILLNSGKLFAENFWKISMKISMKILGKFPWKFPRKVFEIHWKIFLRNPGK